MDSVQFKALVSHMCLVGAVIASWSLTQEMAEWQVRALSVTIIFVPEFSEFSKKHLGKTPLSAMSA